MPIVIYDFYVLGIGRNGVWDDFEPFIHQFLINLLPNL